KNMKNSALGCWDPQPCAMVIARGDGGLQRRPSAGGSRPGPGSPGSGLRIGRIDGVEGLRSRAEKGSAVETTGRGVIHPCHCPLQAELRCTLSVVPLVIATLRADHIGC